jgi:hypothetical protein
MQGAPSQEFVIILKHLPISVNFKESVENPNEELPTSKLAVIEANINFCLS